jgi:predicted RNA binding protein YcfA (HicA-like mRNA interferase family)
VQVGVDSQKISRGVNGDGGVKHGIIKRQKAGINDLIYGYFCPNFILMNGNELIKKLKNLGYRPRIELERGHGSHATLYIGSKRTIIKDRKKEIGKGLLNKMLKELGIDRNNFR